MTGPSVSVVIPVKDDPRVVACVESVLAAAPEGVPVEILVIDNGSADDFSARLGTWLPPGVKLLHDPIPGVYRARNLGITTAGGEVVFFTDADCLARPGWISAGLAMLESGSDIVQGQSGSAGADPASRLLQRRYDAHLRMLSPGDGTETDTRNMAVRRQVFGAVRFNEHYRRVSDTEFGLVAEARGFRVGYAPAMRVDHDHDPDLQVFVAKQVCHGWGAQRLMREHPDVRWHGGHLKLVARVSDRIAPLPGSWALARLCERSALGGAWLLQRCAGRLPGAAGFAWLTALDKLAALAGHFSYRPGAPEPSPSGILGRRLPRD
jgi:glycosyltransferase involved in cell wall biosynthesis